MDVREKGVVARLQRIADEIEDDDKRDTINEAIDLLKQAGWGHSFDPHES
jgi:hypothetical protein